MPDKPLTVLTYAASASLAAVALIYFFNPNYIIDGDANTSTLSRRARVNSVVGLFNPANDCFINSVLQALAGLGELRVYLIRELHRRSLDTKSEVYQVVESKDQDGKPVDRRKAQSLLAAEVTRGLKDMLDRLNERPLQKKIISATAFLAVLESAFATRVNRNQQDAQELLQVVAERLADEYTAGRAARKRLREAAPKTSESALKEVVQSEKQREAHIAEKQDERAANGVPEELEEQQAGTAPVPTTLLNGNVVVEEERAQDELPEEDGFPMEGYTQSQIECQHCHFIPKSSPSSFIMLTLSVPHNKTSSSLNECFDGAFKTEYIDDYRCDRCRLEHAVSRFQRDLTKAKTAEQREKIQSDIDGLQEAISTDPENPPEDIRLPDSKHAPTRRIARSVAITSFPKILVVHLSRSAYDPASYSSKNNAKVVFPERLPLGSLVYRRNYRLLGVVTHKGTHYSGHYETFRRQHIYPPSSNPHNDRAKGPYGHKSRPKAGVRGEHENDCEPEAASEPEAGPGAEGSAEEANSGPSSLAREASPSTVKAEAPASDPLIEPETPSTANTKRESTSSPTRDSMSTMPTPVSMLRPDSSLRSGTPSTLDVRDERDAGGKRSAQTRTGSRQRVRNKLEEVKEQTKRERKKKLAFKESQRWWRISDDRVKECKTSDVLGMQKEVYMLFYEMER